MNLKTEAQRLLEILTRAVANLRAFTDRSGNNLGVQAAAELSGYVLALEKAILEHSRADAEAVIKELSPLMHSINGAATKGELAIFEDDTLERYWKLQSIFRESRFRDQSP